MQLFSNNADASLNGAIASDTTAIVLKEGEGSKFPSPAAGDYFLVTIFDRLGTTELNHEIVKCTSRVGDVLTVTRAQEGTSAKNFPNRACVELRVTAGTLNNKVEKVEGKSLSTEDFTTAEKTKLGGIASGATANSSDAFLKNRANHTGTQAIETIEGLDSVLGTKVSDAPSDGKTYGRKDAAWSEAEPSIATSVAANYWSGDKSWRDFFASVRSATLTGLSTATNAAATATDTVLSAIGKLQAQINNRQETLVSGTNIKTLNGSSLLGAGNVVISGGVSADTGFNTVGSFCVARVTAVYSAITVGSTLAGSSLRPGSFNGPSVYDNSSDGGQTLSGTWRALGHTHGAPTGFFLLFQRIA